MSVVNPVKATSNVKSAVDPLAFLIVLAIGSVWESAVADSLLRTWDGGIFGSIPYVGGLFTFAVKSLTGFYLAFVVIQRVKQEWGDEPSADFRVVLCHYIVKRWQRGKRNKVWLSMYITLAQSLRKEGVLPPCTKEMYLP